LSSYLKKKNTAKKVKDKLCGKLSLEMFRYPGSDFWERVTSLPLIRALEGKDEKPCF
jgi:hypothetical protein